MEILPQFPWNVYAAYFRPHVRKLIVLAVGGCVQSILYVPFAGLLRRIFDVILPSGGTTGLWIAAGGILAIQLGGLLLSYWMNLTALDVNESVTAVVRNDSLAQLYQLPRAFHTSAD